jgi:FMN phosphatase YigB (HAD superfamily)
MQTGLPLPGRGLPAGRPAGQSAEPTPWGQGSRVVALSHEINVCKPDPAAYACVLGRLGMPAGAAAYVGDGSSDELTGARAAGFALVVLAEEAPARLGADDLPRLRAQADTAVASLTDLVALITG